MHSVLENLTRNMANSVRTHGLASVAKGPQIIQSRFSYRCCYSEEGIVRLRNSHHEEANSSSIGQEIIRLHGIRSIITVFIRTHNGATHLILSFHSQISHVASSPLDFLPRMLYEFLIFHAFHIPRPSHSPWFDHPINVWKEHNLLSWQSAVFTIILLLPLSQPSSQTPQLCSPLRVKGAISHP
jgi:hypothetical protein